MQTMVYICSYIYIYIYKAREYFRYINSGISHDNKFDLLVYTNMYKYMLEFACNVK